MNEHIHYKHCSQLNTVIMYSARLLEKRRVSFCSIDPKHWSHKRLKTLCMSQTAVMNQLRGGGKREMGEKKRERQCDWEKIKDTTVEKGGKYREGYWSHCAFLPSPRFKWLFFKCCFDTCIDWPPYLTSDRFCEQTLVNMLIPLRSITSDTIFSTLYFLLRQ